MKQNNGQAMTMPGGILFGAAISFLWTMIAAGFLAWLIHREVVAESSIGYGSMLILLIGSFLGANVGWRKVKSQRLITSLSVGLLYIIMLISLTAFFFGGQYQGMGVTALLVMGGSLLSILVIPSRKRTRQGRVPKIRL